MEKCLKVIKALLEGETILKDESNYKLDNSGRLCREATRYYTELEGKETIWIPVDMHFGSILAWIDTFTTEELERVGV